jgi:hypothetical protein
MFHPGNETVDVASLRRRRFVRLAAAGFFVAFLAIQVVMPIVQLVSAQRPARFGWQMYSVISDAPDFELILRDGTAQPIDIRPYVASLRGDVPLARFVPPHLCTLFPNAAAVHYRIDDETQMGTYQCD